MVHVRILAVPLGGKLASAGPTRNRNFPHVVLNRARYHHTVVALRTHAVQGDLALSGDPLVLMPPLPKEEVAALERLFTRLRRSGDPGPVVPALAELIATIFTRDDGTESAS